MNLRPSSPKFSNSELCAKVILLEKEVFSAPLWGLFLKVRVL